jgi:hypothetical protein
MKPVVTGLFHVAIKARAAPVWPADHGVVGLEQYGIRRNHRAIKLLYKTKI